MEDFYTYQIRLRGQVEAEDINAASPLELTVEQCDSNVTLISVYTDQAGIVGLMRHLHGQGFKLLSVICLVQPK